MKKFYIMGLTIILMGIELLSTPVYSTDKNEMLFPLQPAFLYDSTKKTINPFEMAAWSIGYCAPRYHRDINTAIKDTHWFSTFNPSATGQIDLPFGEVGRSMGIDCTAFAAGLYDATHKIHIPPRISNPESPFTTILGGDCLATYKFKWPVTALGKFALIATPKAGLLYIHQAYNDTTLYCHNLGIALGASVGFDYYINQWVGLFVEYGIKYNRLQFIAPVSTEEIEVFSKETGVQPHLPQQPYHYFTSAIFAGFKTTF